MEEEMITVSIQFPKETYDRVRQLAAKDERSFGYLVRKATELFINDPNGHTAQPAESGDSKRDGKKAGK